MGVHSSLGRHRVPLCRRGSALVPVVAAMLILLLAGVALSELFGAQRMQAVLAVESAQAYWAAEAGLWQAAYTDSEIAGAFAYAGSTFTVTKSGNSYTATAVRNDARRSVSFTFTTSGGGGGSTPSSDNLIAHWNFDETSGSTVVDSVGGHNGTLNYGPTLGAAAPPSGSTAISFDGADDYIEVAHASDFVLSDGTVQLWFLSDDLSYAEAMFSKDSEYYDTGGHFHLYRNGDDIVTRIQSTSASYYVQEPNVISTGTWYHVAVTFGSAGLKLYVNGTLADTNSYTGGWNGNSEPLVFGGSTAASGNGVATPVYGHFDGRIDNVAIYDRALTASEILDLYNAGGLIE